MTGIRGILVIIPLILIFFSNERCFARDTNTRDSVNIPIYFRFDDAVVLRDYRGNQNALKELYQLITPTSNHQIESIQIIGSFSPEGVVEHNYKLAKKRAVSLKGYLMWKHPHLRQVPMPISIYADSTYQWVEAVKRDPNVPHKERVLKIIERPSKNATKIANIKRLPNESYSYIQRYIFPYFRSAVSCVIYFKQQTQVETLPPALTEQQKQEETLRQEQEALEAARLEAEETELTARKLREEEAIKELVTVPPAPTYTYIRKPLFAVKTNLLFDAATALNIELEVPIGKQFSVAAEWIFPWWLWKKEQYCLQLLNGNVEARYWFGNRQKRALLTGWFGGLYVGGGLYDLEWKNEGFQGEFFIAAGATGGYAHRMGRHLRMEYSLGVGYLRTNYRRYIPFENGDVLQWQNNGKYTWLGPTRAKISLVWLLHYKVKEGIKK